MSERERDSCGLYLPTLGETNNFLLRERQCCLRESEVFFLGFSYPYYLKGKKYILLRLRWLFVRLSPGCIS